MNTALNLNHSDWQTLKAMQLGELMQQLEDEKAAYMDELEAEIAAEVNRINALKEPSEVKSAMRQNALEQARLRKDMYEDQCQARIEALQNGEWR